MSTIPPARPIGRVDDPAACTIRPALEWEGQGDWRDIRYEIGRPDGANGAIAKITINRPEVRNAFRPQTLQELTRAFDIARDDPEVGVIVLTGHGDYAFCSGGDQRIRGDDGYIGDDALAQAGIGRLNVLDLQVQIRRTPKPVVAMVAGYAIGGGHVLHVVCDLSIAADNAVFGQAGARVSSPADGFFVPYLTKVVGAKKARELWMLCRKYPAAQALEMGLVNTVVPLDRLEAEVDQWCEEMLALSPGCLEVLKAAFDQEMDGYRESCITSAAMFPDWFDMPEGKEGGAAFMEKRAPEFWDIRRREAEARARLLEEYETRHEG